MRTDVSIGLGYSAEVRDCTHAVIRSKVVNSARYQTLQCMHGNIRSQVNITSAGMWGANG